MSDKPPFGHVSPKVAYLAAQSDMPGPLLRAFMRCLEKRELVALAWWLLDRDFHERQFLAELLRPHFQTAFVEDDAVFTDWLSSLLRGSDYRRALRAGYYVQLLGDCFPKAVRHRLLKLLLGADKSELRARGLRHLRAHWDAAFASEVERIWSRHRDRESAKLVIERFDERVIVREFDRLCDVVPSSGHFLRLCTRVGRRTALQSRIKAKDPISFLYVMAELGEPIAESVAREIYEQHRDSYRSGVILWAIGKLGHWELLREIETRERGETLPIWHSR